MDTLQCMRAFVHVAESGSFTEAARAMHLTTAQMVLMSRWSLRRICPIRILYHAGLAVCAASRARRLSTLMNGVPRKPRLISRWPVGRGGYRPRRGSAASQHGGRCGSRHSVWAWHRRITGAPPRWRDFAQVAGAGTARLHTGGIEPLSAVSIAQVCRRENPYMGRVPARRDTGDAGRRRRLTYGQPIV